MHNPNILLVSNNASLRALVQGTLIVEGYKVDITYKAVNGLTLALLKPLHLFLIDQELPDLSNTELIDRIKSRQELAHIPILALTDNLIQNQCWQCIHAGAQGCLFKPFTGQQLLQLVREYIAPQQVV